MTANRLDRLVRELLGLYSRYSDEEIRRAAEVIASGTATSSVTSLRPPQNLARSSKSRNFASAAKRRPLSAKERLHALIEELIRAKNAELAEFLKNATARRILRAPRDLADFSTQLGLGPSKSDRSTTLYRIGQRLKSIPDRERRALLEKIQHEPSAPSTLAEWSKIIVKERSEGD